MGSSGCCIIYIFKEVVPLSDLMLRAVEGMRLENNELKLNPSLTEEEVLEFFRTFNGDLVSLKVPHNRIVGCLFTSTDYWRVTVFEKRGAMSYSRLDLYKQLQNIIPYQYGGNDVKTTMIFGDYDKSCLGYDTTQEERSRHTYWKGKTDKYGMLMQSDLLSTEIFDGAITQNNLVYQKIWVNHNGDKTFDAPMFLLDNDLVLRDRIGGVESAIRKYETPGRYVFFYRRGTGKATAQELQKEFIRDSKSEADLVSTMNVSWDLTQFFDLRFVQNRIFIVPKSDYQINAQVLLQIIEDYVQEVYNGQHIYPTNFKGQHREVRAGR